MNFNGDETKIRLVVLAELILVGILTIVALAVFQPHGWNMMIVLNVCGLIFLYRLSTALQKRRMRLQLKEASNMIRLVSENMTTNLEIPEASADLAEFYSAIESLRESLAQKEADRQAMLQVVNAIATNIELEKMLEDIIPKVLDTTKSICSAFYLTNPATNMLEIKHSSGFSRNLYAQFDLSLSEGIVGLTAQNHEIHVVNEVPEDTVYIVRTFLGNIKPRSIMSVPVVNQERLLGVLVLASLFDYSAEHVENMKIMKYYLGVAVHNGINYEKNKRMTNELKFQNKLIQDLNNDLERKVLDRTMFLNDVIDSIKDYAIYAMDTNGIIEAWNTGAENLLEFKSSAVMGKHVEILYQNVPNRAENVQKQLEAAMRDGRYAESGWRNKRDGTRYYSDMLLFARYSQTGELVGFTNVIRDMTAYKKAQSELWVEREFSARIMETSSRALLLLDSEGTVIMANRNAREIFNSYDSIGHSFYNYCKNEIDVRKNFQTVLENGMILDFAVVLRNGSKTAHLSVSMIKDSESTLKMLFVSISEPGM